VYYDGELPALAESKDQYENKREENREEVRDETNEGAIRMDGLKASPPPPHCLCAPWGQTMCIDWEVGR
jgi:hypothetical protein